MDILPSLTPVESVVLKKFAKATDVYVSNVAPPDPLAPFELIAFPLKSLEIGYDYTGVSQISCTVEFGFDTGATAPKFSLYSSTTTDIADQTAQSRDFVTAVVSTYFAGSYCFVLTRGVDYDETTESVHILVGPASDTGFTLGAVSMSASAGVSYIP